MAIGDSSKRAPQGTDAHEDVLSGKICARRITLMARWATTVLDLEDAQAYAEELARAAASGDKGLVDRIRKDFRAAGIEILDEVLQDRMVALLRSAAEELRRSEHGHVHRDAEDGAN
ncbi:hypothetical protein ASE36_04980 [Rhizobium sp. Root274]|uniref:ATPase inhibitor subunit zeta n=1 Tax=unclassified Rhizobium TaxID=2613769 RepID=UPI00071590C1|nr:MULTISPECIES: ATPase inhibitor subunit zeta [unclassified Rhizobium]KQW31596.1 hypothetical protein ASC71_04985 [Rhizobium sp. Root1240]KRD33136.1 hypothetical protein ASE36_04980 [Rhizobium sp. Root274]